MSAFSTYRRRRPHVADQVFISSSSITYLGNISVIETPESTYYNSSNISDPVVDSFSGGRLYAKLRSCNIDNNGIEHQEVSLYLDALSDSYHYYESLHSDDDFDSFDSESDDDSMTKVNPNDSGVEMGLSRLPELPRDEGTSGNIYGFTRLAARLRKNWSLTKNDISKSLSRMTKKKNLAGAGDSPKSPQESYQNIEVRSSSSSMTNSLGRKKNWLKFRRTVSMAETTSEEFQPQSLPIYARSTFYLSNESTKPEESDKSTKPAIPPRKKASRPQSPPPPAPIHLRKDKDKLRSTSWYAECGLFKTTAADLETTRPKTACWYAEVGLYQNKKETDGDLNEKMQTLLRDEPLYQFYDAAVTEDALNESTTSESDCEYDGYEEIGEMQKQEPEVNVRTSVRTRVQGCRTLWCEIPEVIQSEILRTLTSIQRKLQEAKFEIVTSEASYLNSLTVLVDHFVANLSSKDLMTEEDRKILFGNVLPVKQCSERLLNDLEACWQDSILLPGICEIIHRHCEEHFQVYVQYCGNQSLADSILKKSRSNRNFADILRKIELSPTCQGLTLHSFLMLPMQRVTRLPLLLDAVFRRLTPSDDDFTECQAALHALQSLVVKCNEAARKTERLVELDRLSSRLEYPPGIPPVDFNIKQNAEIKRYLVRSGELVQLVGRGGRTSEDNSSLKMTFGRKFLKERIFLMVFEDWIIVSKRKSEDLYLVQHHCPRSFLEVSVPDASPSSEAFLLVTLLENQDGRQISLLLTCTSETERARWLEALRPPTTNLDNNETIYESWDRPQVLSIHPYTAIQPDELTLRRGDVVDVDKKMKDGWYHGQRLADGASGWFPANHTQEVANPHVRARNLRQRYRLLAFTDEFLSGQKS